MIFCINRQICGLDCTLHRAVERIWRAFLQNNIIGISLLALYADIKRVLRRYKKLKCVLSE